MKRTLTGVVVSDKMDKTVSVAVTRVRNHPIYRKQFKTTKKFMAHDETNQCSVGDTVIISESRPQSRHKRWTVEEIVEKGTDV